MSQRSAWVRNPSGYRSGPNTPPRIVSHYPLPLARSDPRGRGGGDSHARTHTHTHAHPRSGEQHQRCSGPQSTPRDAPLNLVLLTTMGLWAATTRNGSKWFDPKTSSTRLVPGPQSMTNPYHTQKIDSEPTGTSPVMQKRYSPDDGS